jgi:hypothetical protein
MIWKIKTCRDGVWNEDAMPYTTVERALEVIKRVLATKTCDAASFESNDGTRIDWEAIKQKLGIK